MKDTYIKYIIRFAVLSIVLIFTSMNCTVYAGTLVDYRELLTGYLKPIAKFQIKLYDASGNLKGTVVSSETSIIGKDIQVVNAQIGDRLVISDLSYSRAGYSVCEWDFQYYSEQDTCLRRNLKSDFEAVLRDACTWDFYLCVKDSAPMVNGIENWSDNGNHRAIGTVTKDFPDGLYWYFTKIVVNVVAIPNELEPEIPFEQHIVNPNFNMRTTDYEWVNITANNTSIIDGLNYQDFMIDNEQTEVRFIWSVNGNGSVEIVERGTNRFVFKAEPGMYSVTLKILVGDNTGEITKMIQVFSLPIAKISCTGQFKVNRKVVVSCNDSITRDGYLIDHELDMWSIKKGDQNVLDNPAYVVKRPYKNGTYELMFRQSGYYRIELVITDSRGKSACAVKSIIISDDIPPVAVIRTPATILRNPLDMNKAYIELVCASCSTDGDALGRRKWEVYYDSNNNGDFGDECCMFYDDENDYSECSFDIDSVGRLYNKLTVYDDIRSEDTLAEFLRPEDYKSSCVSKIVEVVNVAPVVSFKAIPNVKADVNFIINEADNADELMDNTANFMATLLANNINSKVEVYIHEAELDNLVQWDGVTRNSSGLYSETGCLIGDKTRFYSKYTCSGSPFVRCYDDNFNYLWTYTPPSVKNTIAVATHPCIDGVYVLYKAGYGYEYAKLDANGGVVWTCLSRGNLKNEPLSNKVEIDQNGNIVCPEYIDSNGNFYIPLPPVPEPFPYTLITSGRKALNVNAKYIGDWCFASGSYQYGPPFIQVFHRNDGYLFDVDFPSSSYYNFGFYVYENTLAVFRHYMSSNNQKTEVLFYDIESARLVYKLPLFTDLKSRLLLSTVQQAVTVYNRYVFFANHKYKGFLLDIKDRKVLNLNHCTSFIDNLFFSHGFARLNSFVDWGDHGTVYSNVISKPVLQSYTTLFPGFEYRDNSYSYNVLINSGCMSGSAEEVVDLISDLKGKFIFIGSNDNGKVMANATGGVVLPYNRDISYIIDDVADYIVKDVLSNVKQKPEGTVLVNECIEFGQCGFFDYENDPPDNCESWKYVHDSDYYENGNGVADFSGDIVFEPITCFDKVGKYEITFRKPDDPTKGDVRFDNYKQWSLDKPNYCLYVHRPPVADFRITGTTENNIFVENNSYDVDRQSLGLSGIKTTEIRYSAGGSLNVWSTVYDTEVLRVGGNGEYIIGLRVQDLDGAWSDFKYDLVEVTGAQELEQMILDFVIPDRVRVNEKISPVEYTAVTTLGNEGSRSWHYFDGSDWVPINKELFEAGNYSFNEFGTYKIRLTGTCGNLSSSVIRNITVLPINMDVYAFINPNPAKAGDLVVITAHILGNVGVESVNVSFDRLIIDSFGQLIDNVDLVPDEKREVWAKVARIGQQVTDTDMLGECYNAVYHTECIDGYSLNTQVDLHIKTPLIVKSNVVVLKELAGLLQRYGMFLDYNCVDESHLGLLTVNDLDCLLDSTVVASEAAGEAIMVLSSVQADGADVMYGGSVVDCLGVANCEQMEFVKECGAIGYFAKKLVIPAVKEDGSCVVYVGGFLANDLYGPGSSCEVMSEIRINTPIQLKPFINGVASNCELFIDKPNVFTALTSKYVSELRIYLNGKIYSSSEQKGSFEVEENNDGKLWILKLNLDEEDYRDINNTAVKFTAILPSGKSQDVILNASALLVSADNFTITLINNVDWRGYYFDLGEPIYRNGKVVGYQKRQNTEIKTYSMPINTSPIGTHPVDYEAIGVKAGSYIKGCINVKGEPEEVFLVAHYINEHSVEISMDIETVNQRDDLYAFDWIVPLDVKNGSFVEYSIRILNNSIEYGNDRWFDSWNDGAEFKVLYVEGNVLVDDIIFNQSN